MKRSHRFVNAPNTELLAVQQRLRESYVTLDLHAAGEIFFSNGCKPAVPIEYADKRLKRY